MNQDQNGQILDKAVNNINILSDYELGGDATPTIKSDKPF
jgi:hypothetical protein